MENYLTGLAQDDALPHTSPALARSSSSTYLKKSAEIKPQELQTLGTEQLLPFKMHRECG